MVTLETRTPNAMRLAHINLVARNVEALATFYVNVMKCDVLREPRTLSGEKVSRGNGLSNSEIRTVWLRFPELEQPFLEIHEHRVTHPREQPRVNEPGFGHLAFQMEDISATLSSIIEAGGAQIGQITDFGTPEMPYLIAYARDPEGNVLELEQTSTVIHLKL
ncbi:MULTISPECIES: VOC family protein [Agrobacterium]|jgi:catechol 2,3-dioxygenase-like lactoylglutathione lyase family enzyme|nr:VOC family protein [Agrobacterium tumefaciens]